MNWALLGGSIAAVLMLAAVAWALGMGRGGAIGDAAAAMAQAEALISGFEARSALVGNDGRAALVRGADGRAALLKLHGTQVAARLLPVPPATVASTEGLRIASGDPFFGSVLLRGVDAI